MQDPLLQQAPGKAFNKSYEKDIQFVIRVCKLVLMPIGLWSLIYGYDRASRLEKFVSVVLNVICLSSLLFVLIPSTWYFFYYEKNPNTRVMLVASIGFCLISTIKYLFLGIRSKSFCECIRYMENDWKCVKIDTFHETMRMSASIGRNIGFLCGSFFYIGDMFFHTVRPLFTHITTSENVSVRVLMHPGTDILFDTQISPNYEIVFCCHWIYGFTTISVTVAACSLTGAFVTHVCGQIKIVMLQLEDLIKGKHSKTENIGKRLATIVRRHNRALKFSGYIDEVLREILLLEVIACTLILCLLEYYCVMEWNDSGWLALFSYIIALTSFTFEMFIFCYIGELLDAQCRKVGDVSYDIDWFMLPSHKARVLTLLIIMSHRPPKLTAGKIIDLSMNTFGNVLKSSLVYLNILRTVTE